MRQTQLTIFLDAAIDLAKRGWRVLPVKPKQKTPQIDKWQKHASTDSNIIQDWWKKWPFANVGIATGKESNLLVLDVDVDSDKGLDGNDALAELERRHGALPHTVEVLTPRGGRHLYFQYPKGNDIPNNVGKLGRGLDIRGEGGYVVGPKSVLLKGRPYAWDVDHHPDETPLAALPDWLLALLMEQISKQQQTGGSAMNGKILDGQRNATLTSLAGTMRRAGMDAEEIDAGLQMINKRRCKPPLDAKEIRDIAASVSRYKPCISNGTIQAPPSHWPELEADAFYGLAGDFTKAVAPYSEADPAGILLHTLLMSGCWIGTGPHALVEHQPHPPRLFVLQIGRTASGRKGTASSHPKLIFSDLEPDWMKTRVKSGLSTGEGLTYLVRDEQTERMPIKKNGRHTGEFETLVTDLGESDKRLLIIEPEFASVLKVMERQGSTLSPKMRDAWDHGNLSPLTKTDRMSATGAHICIMGHITIGELRRYLTTTERGNGFANRFLFALTQRAQFISSGKGAPIETVQEYLKDFSRILRIAQERGVLARDSECEELWASIYPDLEAEMPELSGEILGRGAAQVLRLSLLYSLLDPKEADSPEPAIRTPHLMAALAVWDYCKQSVFYIFGDAIGDPVADRLLGAIKMGPQTETDLYELLGKHGRDGARKGQALDLLVQLKKIHAVPIPTPGRTGREWHFGEVTGCALCAQRG